MKKLLTIIICLSIIKANAQFTLEHTYDSAGTVNGGGYNDQLLIVNFEVSGTQYVKINRLGKVIDIYNINHALVQTISLAGFPTEVTSNVHAIGDVLYLSEHLFNNDPKKEFMYITDAGDPVACNTRIYDESGNILFSDSAAPLIRANFPSQQYPIYNTPNGTKMILSSPNRQAKVWALTGTLSTSIFNANQSLLQNTSFISNPYPNPAINSTTIDYDLPNNVNEGTLVFYDLKGNEVKRFRVDRTFSSLLISTTDIAAGTYYYQLQTIGNISVGKKLVVIK
jgi:hypothetical protein